MRQLIFFSSGGSEMEKYTNFLKKEGILFKTINVLDFKTHKEEELYMRSSAKHLPSAIILEEEDESIVYSKEWFKIPKSSYIKKLLKNEE